jgi:hypothetical protein
VYVIDCSGSMVAHNAMEAARYELISSLGTLKRTQQFQIVFYNIEQKWLKAPGKAGFQFLAANEANLRLARTFIADMQPDGGTSHPPALALGLSLQPDVLFFLTDGGEPGLRDTEMAEIHRANTGRTRIHCVQFASGSETTAATADSFVRKLAQENDGEYVYRDVTRFDSRYVPTSRR